MNNLINQILLGVILACMAIQAIVLTILFVGLVIACLSLGEYTLMDLCEYILLGIR